MTSPKGYAKAGRPHKGHEKRSAWLGMRIEPEVKELLQRAAQDQGFTLADFVAIHCTRAARQVCKFEA